ncbi:hypothetical protein [Actinoplanes sp. TFC3]|uniref:hypothetical protein n=1 Tax=Actinoplanes sp. TFC3 TaxID=1710355 RepID=UPI000A687979|nr:hypothetical protein [Actinoplanes sp. TFC3]
MSDAELFCQNEREEWRRRLDERTRESLRKKEAAAASRKARQARRTHGLSTRHAMKIARVRQNDYPFAPDPDCSE